MKSVALTGPFSGVTRARSQSGQVPTVDCVMATERAAAFTRRSIKTSAKLSGLKLVVSMIDLTTLEGSDTPGKV
ncbi:MAG: deoxyribose-phosphate aldolase, partial [Verrucomicrobia bacterium]|nr:deoxyribose-phosphate aldolase [Verrucomicrobiota bacterium]